MANAISISTLLDYLTYSPAEPSKTAPALRGVWTPLETGDRAYLCARCYGRLLARGVSLVTTACWADDNEPLGVCANCFPAPVAEDDTDEGA